MGFYVRASRCCIILFRYTICLHMRYYTHIESVCATVSLTQIYDLHRYAWRCAVRCIPRASVEIHTFTRRNAPSTDLSCCCILWGLTWGLLAFALVGGSTPTGCSGAGGVEHRHG